MELITVRIQFAKYCIVDKGFSKISATLTGVHYTHAEQVCQLRCGWHAQIETRI